MQSFLYEKKMQVKSSNSIMSRWTINLRTRVPRINNCFYIPSVKYSYFLLDCNAIVYSMVYLIQLIVLFNPIRRPVSANILIFQLINIWGEQILLRLFFNHDVMNTIKQHFLYFLCPKIMLEVFTFFIATKKLYIWIQNISPTTMTTHIK